MFFLDLLAAFIIALVLTLIFVTLFRAPGPWGAWWIFLLVVFLAAWAGGLWVTPIGPPVFNVYWLPMLLVGLLVAMLIAAAVPPAPPRSTAEMVAEQEAATALGVFLWILLLGLIGVIVLAYLV